MSRRIWTKERCAEEALKYQHKKDFNDGSASAYVISLRNGWIPDICKHMTPKSSLVFRYVYEIADHSKKTIYIGLSYNPSVRLSQHRRSLKMIKNFPNGIYCKILRGPMSEKDAQTYESFYVAEYLALGYTVFNSHKTGGLGGHKQKYTYELCKNEALKHYTKRDFNKAARYIYVTAYRRGWLNEICSHMVLLQHPKGHWTKERCTEEALKYSTKSAFNKAKTTAYQTCCRKGWLDELCSHMTSPRVPKGHWTFERIKEVAGKYPTKHDFMKNEPSAYTLMRLRGYTETIYP